MGSSRRRGAPCVRSRAAVMPLQAGSVSEPGSPPQALRGLPCWMRLYFYGMHGVTLDVLLSALQGLCRDWDPRLLGFSSLYLAIAHSLCHLALEKCYTRRQSVRARPVLFHLVLYPSVYIGLQLLVGSVQALSWSSTQLPIPLLGLSPPTSRRGLPLSLLLLLHYLLALYFSLVFHRGLSRLHYAPSSAPTTPLPHPRNHLPGFLRFLFFGMHGFVDEVAFTSLFNLVEKKDGGLSGHTSLWSFLMYGSCSFMVEKLYLHLHFRRGWGTLKRLPLYICVAYAWELSWGLILRRFGACSWDYSHYPMHFMGLVTLMYLPGWVGLSLYQDVLTNVLLRVRRAEQSANGEVVHEMNGQTQLRKKLL